MLVYREGCAIEALKKGEINVLAQVVNCMGVMGSGIAKSIRDEWPEVYEWYKAHISRREGSRQLLGSEVTVPLNNTEDKFVTCLFAQYKYGRGKKHLRYVHFYNSLATSLMYSEDKDKIGVPYSIGCGLAGGDWNVVVEILEDLSEIHNRDIYIYKNKI